MMSDASLDRLAEELGKEWRSLGIYLGLKSVKVQRCATNHPGDVKAAIVEMLILWRQETIELGPKAQVGDLVKALKEIKRVDLAEKVKDGDFTVGYAPGFAEYSQVTSGHNNIIIQARDNARINVTQGLPTGDGYMYNASASSGHASLPNMSGIGTPIPVSRAFSQDDLRSRSQALEDLCVSQLQEMGFSDKICREAVRDLISDKDLDLSVTSTQDVVRRVVGMIIPDDTSGSTLVADGAPSFNSWTPKPHKELFIRIEEELVSGERQSLKGVLAGKIPAGLLEKYTVCEIFNYLEEKGHISPTNMETIANLMEMIDRNDLAVKVRKLQEENKKTGEHQNIPDGEQAASMEYGWPREDMYDKEKSRATGEKQIKSKRTDSGMHVHLPEKQMMTSIHEDAPRQSRRLGQEQHQQARRQQDTPSKAKLTVDLPEEKGSSKSSTTEKQWSTSPKYPAGGSPNPLTDASLAYETLHLQSGGDMQDNLAPNWPKSGEEVTVRPLGDLYQVSSQPSTIHVPALMDSSIPSWERLSPPLSPQPAAPQQQNRVNAAESNDETQELNLLLTQNEKDKDLSDNQPTEQMAANSGEDTIEETSSDPNNESYRGISSGQSDVANANQEAENASVSDEQHPAEPQQQENQPVYDTERRLYIFTRAHIEKMTENFSQSKKITDDDGAFGPVYLLEKFPYDVDGPSKDQPLKDQPMAVKVNRGSADQGHKEFMQELEMSGFRHPHLLPLIGICEDEGCLALIYTYMEKEDLLKNIKDQGQPLSYKQRLRIALDIISAVWYYRRANRFHRDIKSANVLLDGNYRARLGDPGLMRERPSDKSHLSHTGRSVARCGTMHYQCPYYVDTGKFHETSDQFSAGKVLLELLTGKPADAVDEDGIVLFHNWRDDHELEYFRDNTGEGLCHVADVCWPEVTEDGNSVTQRFAKLIVGCLQPHPRRRIKLEVLYQELKDLAKTAGVLGTSSAVMPTVCTYCLACKPCPIPMACGCDYLICIACMKEHGKALYCPNHHADTTGLGQNTFAVIVGQQGFEKDAQDFRDAITNPNICAIREENVAVLLTATIQDVQKAVEQMGAKIKEIPPGQQTTFIYYHSGHAKKEWIPKQGPVSGLKYKDNAVTWSQRLKTILGKSGAHLSLFILDACFASSISVMKMKGKFDSNPSPSPCEADHEQSQDESTGRQDSQEQNMYDNILLVPEGCILWASSRGNEASVPDDNGKSIFTKYIVNGLQDGNCGKDSCSYCQSFQQETKNMGAVSLDFLQKYVWKHVTRDVPMRPSLVSQVEQGYWIAYKQEL